jgi:hypothetical protein
LKKCRERCSSIEYRQKLSESVKKSWEKADERRKQASLMMKSKPNPRKGTKNTEKHKRKVGEKIKFNWSNPEFREKMYKKGVIKETVGLCDFCGEKFIYTKYQNKRFCSHDCYWKFLKNVGGIEGYISPEKVEILKANQVRNRIKRSGKYLRYCNESIEHIELKQKSLNILQKQGYEVYTEVFVWVGNYFRVADVVGFKNNYKEKVVVECGNTGDNKLQEYSNVFQWIIHIPYKGNIKYIKGLFC